MSSLSWEIVKIEKNTNSLIKAQSLNDCLELVKKYSERFAIKRRDYKVEAEKLYLASVAIKKFRSIFKLSTKHL